MTKAIIVIYSLLAVILVTLAFWLAGSSWLACHATGARWAIETSWSPLHGCTTSLFGYDVPVPTS